MQRGDCCQLRISREACYPGGATEERSLLNAHLSEDDRMPRQKVRFSVTRKIALGLTVILVIGMVSMLFIYRGLKEVGTAVHRLAVVEAPVNAAAFEMELNVNGMGFAVLKYLATQRPEYRTWAQKDEQDFVEYHTTYLQLVGTPHERTLGGRVGELHEEFKVLGHTLMSRRETQEKLYTTIGEHLEELDYLLDARLQPQLFSQAAAQRDGYGAAIASADVEAEAAEVGFWVANYHRLPTPEAKQSIMNKLRALERSLANLRSFNLAQRERNLAQALQKTAAGLGAAVKNALVLEDEIYAGRERFIQLRVAMDDVLDDEIQVLALQGLDVPRQEAEAAAHEVLLAMQYLIPLYLLAAGVVGILLILVIRVPLGQLNKGTKAITEGNLTHRIQPISNDEFGDLATQYNRMVTQLQETTVSRNLLEDSETKLRRSVADLRLEIAERERAEAERERLQAELRRNETMSTMGALVAGVAHEVRNPLFGISSTLDAMGARFGEQPEYRCYLDVLRTEVNRLSKLMGDLLSYGRPPTHEFSVGTVDAVVTQAVQACSALAREADATIVNRVKPAIAAIRRNPGRLVQAFQNLIDNALQHAPGGSEVTIEAKGVSENGQRWIEYAVADRGPGFQSEDLPRAFDPFFTRRRGGTGLGLALVQRIVHEHNGEVFVENRAEGGAVVTMRFPLVEHELLSSEWETS